jgi:PHD/YefM family antitoxin component YafN of YafNO toxin-antitoxin module
MTLHPQYITDKNGRKTSVLLSLEEYERLLSEVDAAEDLKLYDKAKSKKSATLPAEEVFQRIENRRKKK